MHAASTIIYAHAGEPLCAYRQPSSPCGRRAIINGNGVEADNDAACRVVIKTKGSWGDAGQHGARMAAAMGGLWARFEAQ